VARNAFGSSWTGRTSTESPMPGQNSDPAGRSASLSGDRRARHRLVCPDGRARNVETTTEDVSGAERSGGGIQSIHRGFPGGRVSRSPSAPRTRRTFGRWLAVTRPKTGTRCASSCRPSAAQSSELPGGVRFSIPWLARRDAQPQDVERDHAAARSSRSQVSVRRPWRTCRRRVRA
jgi:hypothetical protein